MEKKNKTLLLLGIALVALSPFVLFSFDLVFGILLLILGILSIVMHKANKKIPVIVLSALTLVLMVGYVILHGLIVFGLKTYIQIDYEYKETINFMTLLDELSMLLYRYGIDAFQDKDFYLTLYLTHQEVLIPLTKALVLPILLLLVNSITKNRIIRVIASVIVCLGAVTLLSGAFQNIIIIQAYNMDYYDRMNIIQMFIDGADIEEIVTVLYRNYILPNSLSTCSVLTLLASGLSFILACISAAAGRKHAIKE